MDRRYEDFWGCCGVLGDYIQSFCNLPRVGVRILTKGWIVTIVARKRIPCTKRYYWQTGSLGLSLVFLLQASLCGSICLSRLEHLVRSFVRGPNVSIIASSGTVSFNRISFSSIDAPSSGK